MASSSFDDRSVPAPDTEVKDRQQANPHTDVYLVRRIAEIDTTLVKTNLLLESLKEKIDAQTAKIEKLSDQSHQAELKGVEIDTKLQRVIADCGALDTKLDKVRTWVIGATAIIVLLSYLLPPVLSRISWPIGTSSTSEPGKTGRRN